MHPYGNHGATPGYSWCVPNSVCVCVCVCLWGGGCKRFFNGACIEWVHTYDMLLKLMQTHMAYMMYTFEFGSYFVER